MTVKEREFWITRLDRQIRKENKAMEAASKVKGRRR